MLLKFSIIIIIYLDYLLNSSEIFSFMSFFFNYS